MADNYINNNIIFIFDCLLVQMLKIVYVAKIFLDFLDLINNPFYICVHKIKYGR